MDNIGIYMDNIGIYMDNIGIFMDDIGIYMDLATKDDTYLRNSLEITIN